MRWIFLLLLVGCVDRDEVTPQSAQAGDKVEHIRQVAYAGGWGPHVYEFRDDEHHVTCYLAMISSGTGLSCLRDEAGK